ncbi:MAG: hypothetical protein JNL79_17055 [Myxococcales bacterium]|nr:hypothetical protein [Myxococcales bacterium]
MSRLHFALVLALSSACTYDLDAFQADGDGRVLDATPDATDAPVDTHLADSVIAKDTAPDTAVLDTAVLDTAVLDTATPVDAGDDPPLDPAVCKAAATPYACFQCCTTKLPIGAGNAWKGSSGCFCHPSHCKFQCKDTACSKGMADADQPCAACLNSNLTACGPDIPPSSKRFVDCVGGC